MSAFPVGGKIPPEDWGNWRWQCAHAIRTVEQIPPELRSGDIASISEAVQRFGLVITPYYFSLIQQQDPADPICRMAMPTPEELVHTEGLFDDPIAEKTHRPIPGVIRRYPDRAVFLVSGQCAVNCRHCTRRHLGQNKVTPMTQGDVYVAVQYLKKNKEIRDVILSGGDPLLLKDQHLENLVSAIRAVPSVEIIRIGTRVPVTLPMRVTASLADVLARFQPIYINTQFNHPREITPEAEAAVAHLVDQGIQVANQAVLLKGVNDAPGIIETLCRSLIRIRVRPYYLFMCDLWQGTGHFRTSIQTGIDIMAHLRGRLSGLAIPQLVADLPGGIGKIPLGPNHIVSREPGRTVLRAPNGDQVAYPD